jgi:hypothetical protein
VERGLGRAEKYFYLAHYVIGAFQKRLVLHFARSVFALQKCFQQQDEFGTGLFLNLSPRIASF